MIQLHQTQPPLELQISLNSLFDAFRRPHFTLTNQDISYSYLDQLTINEPIGIKLELDTLIYYPRLCKALRKLDCLTYTANISLHDIPTLNKYGLDAITQTLLDLKEKIIIERGKKAFLDSQVNNLVYLYGQEDFSPELQDFKPYYTLRNTIHGNKVTKARKLNISGVNYYLCYYGRRYGAMRHLYQLTEQQLLKRYFDTTKNDENSLSRNMHIQLLGGFTNTPIFVFRSKRNYKQAGKKYYIDLKTHNTMTKISDARELAHIYSKQSNLILLEKTL